MISGHTNSDHWVKYELPGHSKDGKTFRRFRKGFCECHLATPNVTYSGPVVDPPSFDDKGHASGHDWLEEV